MRSRHSRLAALLAAAWEAEVVSARRLTLLAEQAEDPRCQARLSVLSAFCRAHASRLMARLASMGRGPMPVPAACAELEESWEEALLMEIASARLAANRYQAMAARARATSDLSTAWVCELNRAEESDRAEELTRIARGERPDVGQAEAASVGI